MRLKDKVIQCLENKPELANSDSNLTFHIIYTFHKLEFKFIDNKWFISTDILKKINQEKVKRIRAKLNEEGKYLPTDPEVLKKRGLKREECLNFYSKKKSKKEALNEELNDKLRELLGTIKVTWDNQEIIKEINMALKSNNDITKQSVLRKNNY